MTGEVQHDSNIASWLKALNNDKRYIFQSHQAQHRKHIAFDEGRLIPPRLIRAKTKSPLKFP
nr:hypothetical protein [Erwinia billingiae]